MADWNLPVRATLGGRSRQHTAQASKAARVGGEQDLQIGFEFVNQDDEPWQQWAACVIPLSGGASDVTTFTGIRLWVRADQDRGLRLNIDSPESSAAMEGIRFGWDLQVTDQPTQIEVLFADAAEQEWAVTQGRDPGDDLQAVLATATALVFEPHVVNVDDTGFLPESMTDEGFVHIDDIEFF